MINTENFSKELFEEFLNTHPKLKADDSLLADMVKIFSDLAAAAIAKYEKENSR